LWLRVEHNPYWSKQSEVLEKQLQQSLGKTLDGIICGVKDRCCPEACFNTALKAPPAVHAPFLFKHWGLKLDDNGSAIEKAGPVAGVVDIDSRSLRTIMAEFQERQCLHGVRAIGEPTTQRLSGKSPHLLSVKNTDPHLASFQVAPEQFSLDLKDLSHFPQQSYRSRCGHLAEVLALLLCLSEYLGIWEARVSTTTTQPNDNKCAHAPKINCASRCKSVRGRVKLGALKARSAPEVMVDPAHCLPLTAFVLTRKLGLKHCLDLTPGCELWCGGASLNVSVNSCVRLDEARRDFVVLMLTVAEASFDFMITTSHLLHIWRLADTFGDWLCVRAGEVNAGDMIRTATGKKALVVDVVPTEESTEVVEFALSEIKGRCFVSTSDDLSLGFDRFIEVYGNEASQVEILTIKWRPKHFLDVLLVHPDLQNCFNALRSINVSVDLTKHGFGPGKLIVCRDLAPRVLAALRMRSQEVKASNVIVSAAFKSTVVKVILENSRKQHIPIEVLPLPPKLPLPAKVKNSFLEVIDEDVASNFTRSTPKAYTQNRSKDPHAKSSLRRHRPSQSSHQNIF